VFTTLRRLRSLASLREKSILDTGMEFIGIENFEHETRNRCALTCQPARAPNQSVLFPDDGWSCRSTVYDVIGLLMKPVWTGLDFVASIGKSLPV